MKILKERGVAVRAGAHTVEKVPPGVSRAGGAPLDYGAPATLEAAVQGVDAVCLAAPGDFPSAPEKALVDAAKKAGVKKRW